MYAPLRAATCAPSVCLFCTHLSRLQTYQPFKKRHYAAQAALASRVQPTSVDPGPSDQGSSVISSGSNYQGSPKKAAGGLKKDTPTKAARQKKKTGKIARKILKEAEDAERRRKALAVLGKTSKFAAALSETIAQEPTLVDLEQLRPRNSPIVTLKYIYPEHSSRLHHGSPSDATIGRYSSAFQGLTGTLAQKFTRKQLLSMYKEGKRQKSVVQVGMPKTMATLKTRQDVAGEIVRWLWQWPYVSEVKERKAYLTERSERVFPIGTSEFFLLLGPDGSSLLGLTESFKVAIKQVVPTRGGFSLTIEGPNYILDRLANVLTERKKAILSQLVSVGASNERVLASRAGSNSIRPDLLRRISKLSDALVEDSGNGQFRISAHHARNIESATRLTTRAWQQTIHVPPPLLVHLPTARDTIPGMMFHQTYALFPLELPKASSFPWNWASTGHFSPKPSSTSNSEQNEHASTVASSPENPHLFRVKRVSDWLGQHISGNLRHLRDGLGRLFGSAGQPHTLRDALGLPALDAIGWSSDAGRKKHITASTGYVVFASSIGDGNTLSPPFPGSWLIQNLLDWMKTDQARLSFIPSPPQPLVQSSPSDQTAATCLVYRSVLPEAPTVGEPLAATYPTEFSKTIKVIIPSNGPIQALDHTAGGVDEGLYKENWNGADNDNLSGDESVSKDTKGSRSSCQLQISSGFERFVNVMLPDRPMDLQLSVFDSIAIPHGLEPQDLKIYASDLTRYLCSPIGRDWASRPNPPLHLTYEGVHYVLDSNATVQRSSHNISEIENTTDVLTEHAVDLESDQRTTTCQVVCNEPNLHSEWQNFLGNCDRLTWLLLEDDPPVSKLSGYQSSIDSEEA